MIKNIFKQGIIYNIIFFILVAGAFTVINSQRKMYKQKAQRWESNYHILDKRFSDTLETYQANIEQAELTVRELERINSAEIQELKQKLEDANIRTQQLEHALVFEQKIKDTLYVEVIDSVLVNCIKEPVDINFSDSLAEIEVRLFPDLTASASYQVEAKVYGFIYRDKVPARDRDTWAGKTLQKIAMSNFLTRWTVKKKVLYKTDISTNNPNLKLHNTQSLRIIDNN